MVVERWMRVAVEIEFFANADESKLQMTVFVRKALSAGFDEFCERLKVLMPELIGAGVSILPAESTQKRRRDERAWEVCGGERIGVCGCGDGYWVSRGGFFQVNRFLVDELVQVVTDGRRGRWLGICMRESGCSRRRWHTVLNGSLRWRGVRRRRPIWQVR